MMTRRPIRGLGLLVVLVSVLLATSASAAQPELVVRDVYAGGGEPVSAGEFRLMGTTGETVVAPITAAGDFQEGAGFWAKLPPERNLYLPYLER